MADKSSVTRAQAEAHRRALAALLKLDANRRCAECGGRGPTWASVNLGVFVCLNCSGVHRSLGTHISKVRSATLDTWLPSQVAFAARMGNARAASFWEAELPSGFTRPAEGDMAALSKFIGDKYREKRYVSRTHGDVPPTLEAAEGHPFLAQFESGGGAGGGTGGVDGSGGRATATGAAATTTTTTTAPAASAAAALVDLLSLDDPPLPVTAATAHIAPAPAAAAAMSNGGGGGDWAAFSDAVAPSTSTSSSSSSSAAAAASAAKTAAAAVVVDPHDWDAFLAAEPLAAPSSSTTTAQQQQQQQPARHQPQPPTPPSTAPATSSLPLPPSAAVKKSTADKHADILSLFDQPMAPPSTRQPQQPQQWHAAFSPPSFSPTKGSGVGGGGSSNNSSGNGGGAPLF